MIGPGGNFEIGVVVDGYEPSSQFSGRKQFLAERCTRLTSGAGTTAYIRSLAEILEAAVRTVVLGCDMKTGVFKLEHRVSFRAGKKRSETLERVSLDFRS